MYISKNNIISNDMHLWVNSALRSDFDTFFFKFNKKNYQKTQQSYILTVIYLPQFEKCCNNKKALIMSFQRCQQKHNRCDRVKTLTIFVNE